MIEKLPLWEAAKREMEEYQFLAGPELQPKWDVSRQESPSTRLCPAALKTRRLQGVRGCSDQP